jgi:hypothetical protein
LSEPRAIAADFVTFRHVQGRKVLQVVCEVPVEEMGKVFDVLGTPSTGESLWIALAPMPKQAQAEPSAAAPTKEHRKFSELPLPQQAGIRCQDKDFHWFLMDEYPTIAARSTEPKGIICELCGVNTRSELTHGEASGDMWHSIEARYQSWLTDRKFAEARR